MVAISGRYSTVQHRSNVTAVDKIVVPTITAAKNNSVAGSLPTATLFGVAVAPGNERGTAGVSNIVQVTTDTADRSIDITVPACTGAVYFDVFLSTSTTSPQYVRRVPAATVYATGATIAADGEITGEGGAGNINVKKAGTGKLSTHTDFSVNNAYLHEHIEAIPYNGHCTMKVYVQYDVADLVTTPELVLCPFFSCNEYNATKFFAGAKTTVVDPTEDPMFTLDLKGYGSVKLLVDDMKGTSPNLNIYVEMVPK